MSFTLVEWLAGAAVVVGVVTLIYARSAARSSKRQLKFQQTDTDVHVYFLERKGDAFHDSQQPEFYSGDGVRLGVTNRGGTTTPEGSFLRITTNYPAFHPADGWLIDNDPDQTMPGGSRAWRCQLPPIHSNKMFRSPPIVVENEQGTRNGALSWGVWLKLPGGTFRGGNAALIRFSVRLA